LAQTELSPADARLFERARELSWKHFGKRLKIYTPGMFVAYGEKGRYPAVSITGKKCQQECLHCSGQLLKTMLPATTSDGLVELGKRLWREGQAGMLLSGGTNGAGALPWSKVLPAIEALSRETGLILTAHVGRVDEATAIAMKKAGVRQALVDIVGDDQTAKEVLNLPDGLAAQNEALAACQAAGLELAPHLILGLYHGRMRAEDRALETVAKITGLTRLVHVVLMPLKHTPMAEAAPVPLMEAARFMARARLRLPALKHHLGCARPRGAYRHELDRLAVRLGINALALPSDAAVDEAKALGVEVSFDTTCCSLA
jgi:uncharacterized radical SAM superfamily protein